MVEVRTYDFPLFVEHRNQKNDVKLANIEMRAIASLTTMCAIKNTNNTNIYMTIQRKLSIDIMVTELKSAYEYCNNLRRYVIIRAS